MNSNRLAKSVFTVVFVTSMVWGASGCSSSAPVTEPSSTPSSSASVSTEESSNSRYGRMRKYALEDDLHYVTKSTPDGDVNCMVYEPDDGNGGVSCDWMSLMEQKHFMNSTDIGEDENNQRESSDDGSTGKDDAEYDDGYSSSKPLQRNDGESNSADDEDEPESKSSGSGSRSDGSSGSGSRRGSDVKPDNGPDDDNANGRGSSRGTSSDSSTRNSTD